MIPTGGARTPALDRSADRRRRGRTAGAALRPERAALAAVPQRGRVPRAHGCAQSRPRPRRSACPTGRFRRAECSRSRRSCGRRASGSSAARRRRACSLVLVAELAIGAASALGLWQLAQRALAGNAPGRARGAARGRGLVGEPVGDPARDERARDRALRGAGDRGRARLHRAGDGGRLVARGASSASGSRSGSRSSPAATPLFLILWACLIHLARPIEGRGTRAAAALRRGARLRRGRRSPSPRPGSPSNYLRFGSVVPISGLAPMRAARRTCRACRPYSSSSPPCSRRSRARCRRARPRSRRRGFSVRSGLAAAFGRMAARRSDSARADRAGDPLHALARRRSTGSTSARATPWRAPSSPPRPFLAIAWALGAGRELARARRGARAALGSARRRWSACSRSRSPATRGSTRTGAAQHAVPRRALGRRERARRRVGRRGRRPARSASSTTAPLSLDAR